MRHFILFLKSFFSPTPYVEALRGRLTIGWFFLIEYLMLVVLGLVGIAFAYHLAVKFIDPVLAQVPTIQIENGKLVTKLEKPFLMTMKFKVKTDGKPEALLLKIDPTMTYTQVISQKTPEALAYVVKDGVVTYKKSEARVTKYADLDEKSLTLTSQDMTYWIKKGGVLVGLLMLVMLPIFLPFMLLGLCIQLLYSFILSIVLAFLFIGKPRVAKIFTLTWMIFVPVLFWEAIINHFVFLPVPQYLVFLVAGLLLIGGIKLVLRKRTSIETEIS